MVTVIKWPYFHEASKSIFPKIIPSRAYDAFVEALDFSALEIEIDPDKVGNSEYDTKAMMRLLVYGYSYGLRVPGNWSGRLITISPLYGFIGGLKPDHKTIAEFRRKNKRALKKVLKQCAQICIELDLISGNALFVDGAKIRANASRSKTHDQPIMSG